MLKRNVTKGQAFFIGTYPGQSEATVDDFMSDFKGMPDFMGIRASNPESAALHFYNRSAEVIAQGKYIGDNLPPGVKAGIPTNEHGIAFGPKPLLEAACAATKKALAASIAYSNVTDPSKMALTFAVRPRDVLRNGKFVSETVPLARAHESHAKFSAAARQLATKAGGAAALNAVDAATTLRISGSFEFDYIKAHPNFVLEASSVEVLNA